MGLSVVKTGEIDFGDFKAKFRRWTEAEDASWRCNVEEVWIRLKGLPLSCWGREDLAQIVSTFGYLRELDQVTFEKSYLLEERIKIQCEHTDNIPKKIEVVKQAFGFIVQVFVEKPHTAKGGTQSKTWSERVQGSLKISSEEGSRPMKSYWRIKEKNVSENQGLITSSSAIGQKGRDKGKAVAVAGSKTQEEEMSTRLKEQALVKPVTKEESLVEKLSDKEDRGKGKAEEEYGPESRLGLDRFLFRGSWAGQQMWMDAFAWRSFNEKVRDLGLSPSKIDWTSGSLKGPQGDISIEDSQLATVEALQRGDLSTKDDMPMGAQEQPREDAMENVVEKGSDLEENNALTVAGGQEMKMIPMEAKDRETPIQAISSSTISASSSGRKRGKKPITAVRRSIRQLTKTAGAMTVAQRAMKRARAKALEEDLGGITSEGALIGKKKSRLDQFPNRSTQRVINLDDSSEDSIGESESGDESDSSN